VSASATAGRGLRRGESAARSRILATADRLFYCEGIRSVGVERLVAESQVTNATFYRHFRSKDELVVAYVRGRLQRDRDALAELRSSTAGGAVAVLDAIAHAVVEESRDPSFRGCPYLNVAVEHANDDHPSRAVCEQHGEWLQGALVELLVEAGHPQPELVAEQLRMLRAGAMAVLAVRVTETAADAFIDAWRRLVSGSPSLERSVA
jgi:AcrR family transcriptional regulator